MLVNPDLSVPGQENVFAIGDAAAVSYAPNRIVPGLAAAAKQMGRYVGGVIALARARRIDRSCRSAIAIRATSRPSAGAPRS